jgi:hypothetical protein
MTTQVEKFTIPKFCFWRILHVVYLTGELPDVSVLGSVMQELDISIPFDVDTANDRKLLWKEVMFSVKSSEKELIKMDIFMLYEVAVCVAKHISIEKFPKKNLIILYAHVFNTMVHSINRCEFSS